MSDISAGASEPSRRGVDAPGWLSGGRDESRWFAFGAIAVAAAVQLLLPDRLSLGPAWLLPCVEGAIAVGLLIAVPNRRRQDSPLIRQAGLLLVAVMSIANGFSAALLIRGLLGGRLTGGAGELLANGTGVYVTNIIAFALWYWELDRGGPLVRAVGTYVHPDFLFPQMSAPNLARRDWQPTFLDYLYVSFTNATAFSPTDTMPLTRWAKMLMLVQSGIALLTVALVIARAVNIFK
ncbi:MAG: hypothetical protein M3N46_05090 [Actinomycetota bacterium]|nr:hypothetical protein [Actinomycetota bacterium]